MPSGHDFILSQIAGAGSAGQTDQVEAWANEAMRIVCSHNWSFLRKSVKFKIPGVVVTDPDYSVEFTWVRGNKYIEVDTPTLPPPLDWKLTGRFVSIGDVKYRTVDIGYRDANRIYVDSEISESGTATSLSLYRDEAILRTSNIYDINYDNAKQAPTAMSDYSSYVGRDLQYSSYVEDSSHIIPTPVFPPINGTGTMIPSPVGDYVYYFVRFDFETGLESAPGPYLRHNSRTGSFSITYDSLSGNSESTSYGMRLYRCTREQYQQRLPCPAWLMNETGPIIPVYYEDKTKKHQRPLQRYWDGRQTTVKLGFHDEPKTYTALIGIDHGYGIALDDQIILDDRGVIDQLAGLYIAYREALSGKSPEAQRKIAEFNRHLTYLLSIDKGSSERDHRLDQYKPSVSENHGFEAVIGSDFLVIRRA